MNSMKSIRKTGGRFASGCLLALAVLAVAHAAGRLTSAPTAGPIVTLSSTSLTFGKQVVGTTTSYALKSTLTNTGDSNLTLNGLSVTGDFSKSSTCTSTLAPGASCIISAKFTPTASGTRTGTLSITDDAPGSPQMISLTGTGTVVSLSPSTLNFGSVKVGTSSSTQTITLTNVGTVTLNLTRNVIQGPNKGDFSKTSTCGMSVAAGGNCTITVTFTPTATGARSAAETLTDDGGGSPQSVPMSGTGT